MRILVSGASGFMGQAFHHTAVQAGHAVAVLVRRRSGSIQEIEWNPALGQLDAAALKTFAPEAVVNFSGRSIAEGRWTAAFKADVLASRLDTTRTLVDAICKLDARPHVLLSASAVGYYGNPSAPVDESSPLGEGFLADVCRQWEAEAMRAQVCDVRVCTLRFGVILGWQGGMLGKLAPIFKAGLGGPLGSGEHKMSWIAIDDACAAILHALQQTTLTGAINLTAPEVVSNAEFTKALARHFRRPAVLRVPAFAIRAIFGNDSRDVFFQNVAAHPQKLLDNGFVFRQPTLQSTLQSVSNADKT